MDQCRFLGVLIVGLLLWNASSDDLNTNDISIKSEMRNAIAVSGGVVLPNFSGR